jgi:hypothetical protein
MLPIKEEINLATYLEIFQYKLIDLFLPVPNGTFGRVAASFRLRNLREISIYPFDEDKRRLKPAATKKHKIKSLDSDKRRTLPIDTP